MRMFSTLIAVVFALVASAAGADSGEALGSPKCLEALESLRAHEAALPAAPQASVQADRRQRAAPIARLEALRRLAARACLGGRNVAPSRTQRDPGPSIVVPPVVVARPLLPPTRPPAPATNPVGPVTVITACDAVGCWASDGSRLHRVGPNLQGPRGLCSVQGGVLQCP